ncbi:hypothetical protein JRO89_XS04G0211700 [Xanthoceras sorbifolium]|uniref:PRA1 family protein n=1 Tax=Xanthoceras sorbifolium TaxID=99658 RepID=A0ABQ8I692_9ROSI|nr:hypothetical protein JRO89_XS04G0211700 [Xanthoceras sorbifolium]
MTSYGTIPADSSPTPSSSLSFIVRAKDRIQSSLGEPRPWKEMIQAHSFNLPTTLSDSIQRIRTNVAFFRINYAIIVLFLLFVSLLWTPISLAALVLLVVLWLFLYFLRDQPLMVFGRLIDDRVVMMVLLMATVAVLFLTNVTDNLTVGMSVGMAVILAHGVLRSTEDSFAGDDDIGLDSSTMFRGGTPLPLKNPASSSFTSS